jgi:hypothetical protein
MSSPVLVNFITKNLAILFASRDVLPLLLFAVTLHRKLLESVVAQLLVM